MSDVTSEEEVDKTLGTNQTNSSQPTKKFGFSDQESLLRNVIRKEAAIHSSPQELYNAAAALKRSNLEKITSMYGSLMNINIAAFERENSPEDYVKQRNDSREGTPPTPPLFPKFPVRSKEANLSDGSEYSLTESPMGTMGLANRSSSKPRTLFVISGGRGYFNWSKLNSKDVSNSDAHTTVWEMKLVG